MGKFAEIAVPVQREEVRIKDVHGEVHVLYVCELTALRQELLATEFRERCGEMSAKEYTDAHPNLSNALLLAQSLQDADGNSPPLDWVQKLPRPLFESLGAKALAINSVQQERLEKN